MKSENRDVELEGQDGIENAMRVTIEAGERGGEGRETGEAADEYFDRFQASPHI